MSEARERILSRVRAATETLPGRRALPGDDAYRAARSRQAPMSEDLDTLAKVFGESWEQAGGELLTSRLALETYLEMHGVKRGYVDPHLQALLGPGVWTSAAARFDRENIDAFDFGITEAAFGIAETGTVVLTDGCTPDRLAALAPWIHIAVLRKDALRATLADALASLPYDPCVVFVTGPSKTADIEGILVKGVHGPGAQAALLL